MVTLQQLRYFSILADVLHFTKASEILHITQPTLSYAINELQKDLGVPLFERTGNQLSLTRYGSTLLPYANKALETVNLGLRSIEQMLGSAPSTINLGYIYSVSTDLLPSMVSRFQDLDENRNISFHFFQGVKDQILNKIQDGSLDLAFACVTDEKNVKSIPLFTQELFLVVPKDHPLSRETSVTLEQVKDESFIIAQPGSGLRLFVERIFETIGLTPTIAYEVEECNAMVAFVSSRQGVAIMPKIPLLHSSNVSLLKVSAPKLKREISLIWKTGGNLPPASERFRRFVLDFQKDT